MAPDRFGSDERLRQRVQERLQRINQAYSALESGDLEPEMEGPVYAAAPEQSWPQQRPPMRRTNAGSGERALRGWVYLTIFLVTIAFVGYAVARHLSDVQEQSVAAPSVETAAASAVPAVSTTSKTHGAGPEEDRSAAGPVVAGATELDEAQMQELKRACGAFAVGSTRYANCVHAHIGAGGGANNVGALTEGERTSIKRVCAQAGDYDRCAADQMAELAAEPYRPNLQRLSARDRAAVEKAALLRVTTTVPWHTIIARRGLRRCFFPRTRDRCA